MDFLRKTLLYHLYNQIKGKMFHYSYFRVIPAVLAERLPAINSANSLVSFMTVRL